MPLGEEAKGSWGRTAPTHLRLFFQQLSPKNTEPQAEGGGSGNRRCSFSRRGWESRESPGLPTAWVLLVASMFLRLLEETLPGSHLQAPPIGWSSADPLFRQRELGC